MLSEGKMAELSRREPILREYYLPQANGFYRCKAVDAREERMLKERFSTLGFSALAFTDSRSTYQFYALKRLWEHIARGRELGLRRLNLTAPPLSAGEVYRFLSGEDFVNHLEKPPYSYDLRSRYAELFGGKGGYTLTREQELEDIATFVRGEGGECR